MTRFQRYVCTGWRLPITWAVTWLAVGIVMSAPIVLGWLAAISGDWVKGFLIISGCYLLAIIRDFRRRSSR